MSKFTLELRYLAEDPNFNIFAFPYDFIDEDLKGVFEQRFIEHFYFHEIGFETVRRFQQRLMATLNRIAPYYKQLYETELASKKIDFLLNKDLKETFIRELQTENNKNQLNENENNLKSNDDTLNEILNKENSSSSSNGKESSIDGALSRVGEGYITNENIENITANSNSTNTSKNTSTNTSNSVTNGKLKEDEKGKELEKTELISQGNIGVTSSAELLEKWRSVLINIFEMYLEECENLFMLFM